nr:mesothelin isoform X2 [Danio rerio]|eukprot:XP_021330389.1 mesothelin isoform X2 [Danio rerio]
MIHFQLSVLLALGFITLINGQCVVDFQNGTVSNNGSSCSSFSNSTLNSTLSCAGIQLSDYSLANLQNLKAYTDATFDLYTLLRSRLDASLVVSYINNIRTKGSVAGSLSDVDFARLWFQVKLSPFLSSLSRDTLSCLSRSSFTCQSFQALVNDLSVQIGPERQRMVYQNFIKPFLARNTTDAGCVNSTNSTGQWLLLNFQSFSSIASLGDFIALKPDFNGLVVLGKLTPEQKAELMFQLEANFSLNADAVSQIFQSFLQPLINMTLNLTSTSSGLLDKNLTDFVQYLRPMGRFIRSCVNIAQTTNISSFRNDTIQLLVNWTVNYINNQISVNTFNFNNISEWFQTIVIPLVNKHLQTNQTLPDNTTDIFNSVFAVEAQTADPVDICTVTINNSSCQVSQNAESLAKTLKCVAQTNLSLTEENLQLLTTELSKTLQTKVQQSLGVTNSSQSNLTTLFGELPAESFTIRSLDDVNFVKFWFQIKMKPLLPKIPKEFLSCLNTRSFSCQTYTALIVELSNNFGLMDSATQRSVFNDFIVPFLTRRQNTSVDCTLAYNNSVNFILQNFGSFSQFAQLQFFTNLSLNFSAVEAVPVLSLTQLGELVFSPPARPEDRVNILTKVFDFLLQASNRDKLNSFLPALQTQARKANFSCENYKTIFDRVDQALLSVSPNQTEALLTIRDSLMTIPPDECIQRSSQCTVTPVNETVLCANVNSSAVGQVLNGVAQNTTSSLNLCNFTVLEFACLPTLSQVNSQQLAGLLACKLNSNVTKETWKLFLSKTSTNLDDALLKLSNMTLSPSNVSLSNVLDVIADVRIDRFSPQRLRDPVFIRSWFQGRLKTFLPSISQSFLSCLSTKNLACESYSTIIVELSNNFGLMDSATQRSVFNDFIVPFLSRRQNTSVDCTLAYNNSVNFILQNFGSFSQFAQLQFFTNLSLNFSAVSLTLLVDHVKTQPQHNITQLMSFQVEAVPVLSLTQLGELVFSPPARPEDRVNILTKVFDFLLQASNRDKLNSFLPALQTQARKANFSCENYKTIFDRVDQALLSVSPNQTEALLTIRDSLMTIPPDECIQRSSQCTVTPVNETVLCANINSSAVGQVLNGPNTTSSLNLCNFTVLEFACLPTLSQVNSQQLAGLLACKLNSNVTKETWKLFLSKTSTNLDDALLKLSNMTLGPSNVSLSNVLDVIADVRIDRFSPQRLRDPVFIRSWFQNRLKPFLPSVSQSFLSCLSTKNLTCESYSTITESFINAPLQTVQDVCNPPVPSGTQKQDQVYRNFMKAFLSRSDTNDPGCLKDSANTTLWVNRYFGPLIQSANLTELLALDSNFKTVEVLPVLSLNQLVEFSLTPGALANPQSAIKVMQLVKDCQLPTFFDRFSPKLNDILLTPDVKTALIKQIFDRANLSDLNTANGEVLVWIQTRLPPLLSNFSESLVSPFFTILNARDCNITQFALKLLGGVGPSIPPNTKNAIYNSILQSFGGPQGLRCYRNNSFMTFLNQSLFSFGPLPNLTTFLSLIPPARISELLNSFAPSELGTYLRQLKVLNNDSQICVIFNTFTRTPDFLENEDVPDNIRRAILPCVWPMALTSDNQTEINLWFDRRLKLYLKFLNKDLIGSKDTLSSSCLSYRKMINVLGNSFTFSGSQITSNDVYSTIKTYLKADSTPKCYDASNPKLSSTAWFSNYIGTFITFLNLDDLYTFGSDSAIQIFTVDPDNINLFKQKNLPNNLTSHYTQLLFQQNPSFNVLDLPTFLQCSAPASTFTKLDETQTNAILGNFKTSCSGVDPAISTALAGNIKTISANVISNMGSEIVGLTTVQLNAAPPDVLISSLSTLTTVSGWNFGQAKTIIKVLLSGSYQLTSPTNLVNLGPLITGIPSTVLTSIDPVQIVTMTQNVQFVNNMLAAPEIVQKTFVNQIIKVNTEPSVLMQNIPSELAVQIPRNLLDIPSTVNTVVIQQFNNKKWKPEQAVLFFDSVANAFDQADDLSVPVLQGFTCSRVQTFTKTKIRGLIKACRRRPNRQTVILSETQLTCMYNLIRRDSPLDFFNYHPNMLLYYNYDTINKTICRDYFTAVGAADLSIFSSTLRGRRDILWSNAVDCLAINGTSIRKQDLTVLGNLVCVVSSDYITNSDPEILENLKNCNELSVSQIAAMEAVIMKGTTKYGPTSKWNQKTLNDLGILPLHFSQNFWGSFQQIDTSTFLKSFLKFLRGQNTPKLLMKRLFKAIIIPVKRAKRAAGDCTAGNITSVTISNDAFPFGYDETQFGNCLSADVVRDNLGSLCEKIDDSGFQRIILDRLKQIYPNGLSDDQVQVLKSVSRNVSLDEVSKWNITKVDTLAALMNTNDGDWSSEQSKQIISQYLSAGNNLTATELNLIKGPNLCSMDTSTISTILPESIRGSDALNVSKCSSANKQALFTIASKAFPMTKAIDTRAALSSFQLIEPFLGGADLNYIRTLSSYNISMSLSTFTNLDPNVINSLTVSDVVGLLGSNLQDLKTYENQTAVRNWISLQLQSELNNLNISLTGGKATADTTTAAPTTASSTTLNAAAASTSSSAATIVTSTNITIASATANTTSAATGVGYSMPFSIFVLVLTIFKVEII